MYEAISFRVRTISLREPLDEIRKTAKRNREGVHNMYSEMQ